MSLTSTCGFQRSRVVSAAPADATAKAPGFGGGECELGDQSQCTHNQYEKPDVDTGNAAGDGVDVNKLLGYRWDAKHGRFVQVEYVSTSTFQLTLEVVEHLSEIAGPTDSAGDAGCEQRGVIRLVLAEH